MKKMNKGFTLVELIIVIAILAIIMLIAIPNFSGIQQRMKVRADKATAAQIGKAVRVWYTDYTTDPLLSGKLTVADSVDATFVAHTNCVDYTKLDGISAYTSKYEPTSLLEDNVTVEKQYYVVGLTSGDASQGKICVGIVAESSTEGTPNTLAVATSATYNGTADAVAYVEP